MAVSDYSTTAGDNAVLNGLAVSDAQTADNVDNLIRELMADVRLFYDAPVASDAGLTSLAALGTAGDKGIYTTAADTFAEFDLTAQGRALLDDADAAAQRATLGLGLAATENSEEYFIAKTSDETKTSDTTIADDTELTLTVPTGRFGFEACIFTSAGAGQVDLGFTIPGAGSALWWNKSNTDGALVLSSSSTITVTDTSSGTCMTLLRGQFRGLVADGTFALRWAQASSNAAGSTVKLNSFISLRKRAG